MPMKSLLTALVLCSLAAVALAPTASAGPPSLDDWPTCLPAAVGRVCVSPSWPGCNAWIEWTAIPAQPTCLYRTDGLQANSAADVQCMDVYSRTDVGTLSIVRRNSCAAPEFYQCPSPGAPLSSCHGLLEATLTSSALDAECMDVYSQTHVAGPYWIVRRDSCSVQLYECPTGSSPPAPPCREAQIFSTSSAAPPVGPPPMECYDIYSRWGYGPAYVVLTSSCSGHVELCGDKVEVRSIDTSCIVQAQSSATLPQVSDLPIASPPINCMPYYNEHEVGPVTVVQGGCGNDVRLCDDSVLDRRVDASCVTNALAAPPSPNCIQIYQEADLGPVRYVRSGCDSTVYVCDQTPQGILASGRFEPRRCETGVALPPVECAAIYARHEVGPAAMVLTSGCSGHAEVCGQHVAARDLSCLLATTSAPQPVPDPLARTCSTTGMGELQSRYCVDPTSTDCTVYVLRSTGVGSEWWCYPSGEHGSDF